MLLEKGIMQVRYVLNSEWCLVERTHWNNMYTIQSKYMYLGI